MLSNLLKIITKSIFCLMLFGVANTQAGIEKLIKNVMPSGTMSNVTKNAIVQEQSAGHLMGGSVIIKTPANPGLQLVHAQAPSCKMGRLPCGAQFEVLGGSLSLINSAELMKHLKGMVQNAAAYGGIMAIKTLCPQCEDIMTWMDSKADWLNNLLKTDCEDMTKLAGGILGKVTAGSRATRQSDLLLKGEGKDMADFAKGSKTEADDPTGRNPELESLLGDNYNLVWKALEKKAAISEDGKSLKELLMSISGTIIGRKDGDGKRSVIHKKSLVSRELIEEFIGAKGGGGTIAVNLYSCDEGIQCLSPVVSATTIKSKDTLMGRISELLVSIAEKIQTDKGPYSPEEETLIALSSLQLITKIELDLKTYSSFPHATAAQTEFVEALCFDVVTTYLAKLLQETQVAVGELAYAQIADSGVFNKFDEETRETMRALSRAKNEAYRRYDLIAATKARIRQEISYFDMQFEEFLSGQNNG